MTKFFCALCRTPREISLSKSLSPLNYVQIIFLSMATMLLSFPLFGWAGAVFFLVYWAGFETAKKLLYRRQLKCENCGFDPTWYRRDVKLAKKFVERHLQEKPLKRYQNLEQMKEYQ